MSSGINAAFLMTYIGSGLSVIAVIPYAKEILKGQATPRIVTWVIWGALSAIGAAGAYSAHQLPAATFAAFNAAECFVIAILGLRNRDLTVEKLDIFCFIGAVCGFAVLVGLNNPMYAVLASIVIDFIGSLPTLKHAWKSPEEETASSYMLYAVGAFLVIFAVNLHLFTSVAYPAYILVIDTSIAGTIMLRSRRNTAKPKMEPAATERAPTPVPRGLTNSLIADNSDLWREVRNHPLQELMSQESMSLESAAKWAQQRVILYQWDMRTFALLRGYRRSAIIDQLLHFLATETANHGRSLSKSLESTGTNSPHEEWPTSLGYATYVYTCAQEGILEGLVAMYTRQLLQLRVHANLDESIQLTSSQNDANAQAGAETFRTGVLRFSKYIDAYAGQPSQLMHAHLAQIARNVMRFELAFMDEVMDQAVPRGKRRQVTRNRETSMSRRR